MTLINTSDARQQSSARESADSLQAAACNSSQDSLTPSDFLNNSAEMASPEQTNGTRKKSLFAPSKKPESSRNLAFSVKQI